MPDGLNTYKSTLTGPELDEALRNIGKVQANIEKAAGYAETAEQYGTIVEQNQTAIQAIEDNLPAVQGAAANAQSAAANAQAAAQSAQEAQTAAQQALGFRTFFSAVSPDENGDLDPSRPMTTPTAQASWTIKSKGDRIQSVQIDGFTTQAGTGDPSPVNVRDISTAGTRMVKTTFDGSSDEAWTWDNGFAYIRLSFSVPNASQIVIGSVYCDRLSPASTSSIQGGSATNAIGVVQASIGVGTIFVRISGVNSLDIFKQNLQQNPISVYVEPADKSQATGLYVPIRAQGHEYRCKMLELTAPLCDGDTVESNVPSGCDKRLVLDGSSDEAWIGTSAPTWFRIGGIQNFAGVAYANHFFYGGTVVSSAPSGSFVISGSSLYVSLGVESLEDFKSALATHPLKVWYRSAAYTEANDIPVALETHNWFFDNFTSEDTFSGNTDSNWIYTPSRAKDKKTNGTVICSHFKGVSGNSPNIGSINKIAINANGQYVITSSYGSDSTAFKAYVSAQETAGTPVTIVYELATPIVYAHDPVELVAVPYTEADATTAQQLASTPSTLPYIDSADVPMLLGDTAQPMALAAPLASTLPVAGTYVVSSQDGTTVLVSLKAMQDGGDAATLEGMTLEDIKVLISSMIADANK